VLEDISQSNFEVIIDHGLFFYRTLKMPTGLHIKAHLIKFFFTTMPIRKKDGQ
jgi:hypothetical protein